MMEFIRSWVFNIVTLVIFIVLIEILVPSGKTKKFINLASGFILLIALINPLLGLFDKGVDLNEIQISDSNFIDKREIETNSKILKESQMKQITDTYKRKLIMQLEDSVKEIKGISSAKADVIINEDYNSESFGEIKRAYLSLRLGNKSEGIIPVTKVEKIQISRGDKKEKVSIEVDGELKKQIETRINKLFDLKKENIVIALQEKS